MTVATILDICQDDISIARWIRFSYSTLRWFEWSPLAYLMLGGVLMLGFLIVSGLLMRGFILLGRGRRLRQLWLWGFPIALFLSVSPLMIGEPLLTQFLATYRGQTADAIVVLGRGIYLRDSRVTMAADLLSADRAPRVFVSGRGDALFMADMLNELGVASDKIAGEDCSITTEQNAQYTAQQLRPAGVKSIILVSDPPHLLRSQLVFRSLGFRVIPYASPLPKHVGLRRRRLLALRESVGLVGYGLMGRYWPRPVTTRNTTAAQQTGTQ